MPTRVRESDLTIPVLLALRAAPNGQMTTSDLIEHLRTTLPLSDGDLEILDGRNDERFTQIIRNMKSHKESSTNIIYLGYIQEIPRGFRITQKGVSFLESKGL